MIAPIDRDGNGKISIEGMYSTVFVLIYYKQECILFFSK